MAKLYTVKHIKTGKLGLHIATNRKKAIENWINSMIGHHPGCHKDAWKVWKAFGYITVEVKLEEIN